jgi:hypothetical protein
MRRFRLAVCVVAGTVAMQASLAWGQAGYGLSTGAQPSFRAPGSYQRLSGQNNPALQFFGGSRAVHYTAAGRRQQQVQTAQPVQTAAYMKPYAGLQPQASISPYLALDQLETPNGLPNYHLFVQPRLEQQALNHSQQIQNRRLQQQVRRATATGALAPGTSGGIPTTGYSSQFMNNGGYYPGLQR